MSFWSSAIVLYISSMVCRQQYNCLSTVITNICIKINRKHLNKYIWTRMWIQTNIYMIFILWFHDGSFNDWSKKALWELAMRGRRSPSTASLKLRRLHAYTILFRKPWSDTDSACTTTHGRKYKTQLKGLWIAFIFLELSNINNKTQKAYALTRAISF